MRNPPAQLPLFACSLARPPGLRALAAIAAVFLAAPAMAGLLGDRTTAEVALPDMAPVHLRYAVRGPDSTRFEAKAILSALREAMARLSKMPVEQIRGQSSTRVARLERLTSPDKSMLVFRYVHKHVLAEGPAFAGQELTFSIPYTLNESNDAIDIDLTPAPTASLLTSTQLIYSTLKVDVDQAMRDMNALLVAAPSIRLKMVVSVKAEAQSKYPPPAVMANFQRILGKTSGSMSGADPSDPFALRGTYSFGVGNERVPLGIQAFPYRDGTKVVYEASLPCYLGNGQPAENVDAADRLRATVEKILMD